MSRLLRPTLVALGVGLAALVVVLATTPAPAGRTFDVYLLYLGAVILLALVFATSAAPDEDRGSAFEAALERPHVAPERPRRLERLEREVHLAASSGFYLHHRLRPTLRAIARQRLLARGIDLDHEPGSARAVLGEAAWALVGPEAEPPRRDERGLPVDELRAVIEDLERI